MQILQDDPLPTQTPPRSESTLHWADRDDEVMDYEAEVTWDVDDDDLTETKGVKLFKVGERTEKFLDHFFGPLPNQTRRQWRDKYGAPSTAGTACPTIDKVLKGRLPAATKLRDRQLAKQQALMLDAVGPVTYILESAAKGELTQKPAIEAIQTALKLLGNASGIANRERRKSGLQSLNPRLVAMAEDEAIYKTAGTLLFGEGFTKKAKERDDELKCLNQATSSTNKASSSSSSSQKSNFFFQSGRPYKSHAPCGAGRDYRGQRGGYQRNHPYHQSSQGWQRNKPETKKQ